MMSWRTFTAFTILVFSSVIHSASATYVYYGSWYLYFWIPFLIIAIIRCCCYLNQKKQPEQRVVVIDPNAQPGVINTSGTSGGMAVVMPPEQAPPYGYPSQGPVINSAYTPGPGDAAYPPNAATSIAYPPPSTAFPPPPAYNDAIKIPVADGNPPKSPPPQ